MNDIRRKILVLALVFLPAFGLCLFLYPHVQPQYQKAVVAAVDVGLHHLDPPMRIEISEDGGWTTFTLRPDGTESFYWSRPGKNLTLFYIGLALLPALLIATPVSLKRRVRLLVIGMFVLFALQVVAGFGLVVSIRCLAGNPDAMLCTWAKTVGNTFGQVSAFVIWVGLTWPAWFPGSETTDGTGRSRSIGR
ncbi:MAG: hypothetical protein GY722_28460, partial [bacterium]|nr:hypothetical protein [bacterium]